MDRRRCDNCLHKAQRKSGAEISMVRLATFWCRILQARGLAVVHRARQFFRLNRRNASRVRQRSFARSQLFLRFKGNNPQCVKRAARNRRVMTADHKVRYVRWRIHQRRALQCNGSRPSARHLGRAATSEHELTRLLQHRAHRLPQPPPPLHEVDRSNRNNRKGS